ncbi:cytochrome b561 domain-containing protein At4g18260-like isoform X2 [Ananas comosus]|uniref:Cytochrome b561 domain-containing protein At4g18260-like isoform X2 n=1 Tax=Ananas comosus TaxID=4615 RepID=A0A6P5G0H4_ANACO|nr:cytochrome b561 domain-containing protein At4g18260-like isoform X2 [Ananas comosus]
MRERDRSLLCYCTELKKCQKKKEQHFIFSTAMPATCGGKGNVTIYAALMLLLLLLLVLLLSASVDAARNSSEIYENQRTSQNNPLKLTPQISVQIKVHAFLLWASFGFLIPVGVLIIRMSNNTKSAKSLKILFFSHVIVQIISVLLASAGAILSIKNFANSFENTHQRMGLALYGSIWLQSVFGFFRPNRSNGPEYEYRRSSVGPTAQGTNIGGQALNYQMSQSESSKD